MIQIFFFQKTCWNCFEMILCTDQTIKKMFRLEKQKRKLAEIPPVKFNLRVDSRKNEMSYEEISKKTCLFVDMNSICSPCQLEN